MTGNEIEPYMKQVFETYINIKNSNNHEEFWDLVVLTTFDQNQKSSFEKLIEEYMGDNFLLKGKLFVVSDPPNQKLGCGGSTMFALKTLSKIFGSDLYGKRILVIHSGGCSQRLPSYSVQGKLFSPVPVKELISNSRVSYMIDLKLAMYLPFCKLLRPGIFVTCGDDIETFYLDPMLLDKEALQKAEVVALAHPCDLNTASGHGVYILPPVAIAKSSAFVSDCLEVLQKPSITLMREKNAIFVRDKTQEEMVYSDSVFWMSENAYRPLLSWYLQAPPISELDAYAHFLTCIGTSMRSCSPEQFQGYKKELLPLLKNLDFKVIVLNVSKFYHMGTMEEYLFNFTECQSFSNELHLIKNTSNVSRLFTTDEQGERACIISSHFNKENKCDVTELANVVIEWCDVDVNIHVSEKLVLSNCLLRKDQSVKFLREVVHFFGSFLYHTIPLVFEGTSLYVTVAFEIQSNLKHCFSESAAISFASVPLKRLVKECHMTEQVVIADGKPYSLWNLKLFCGTLSAEESFWRTHNFINKVLCLRDGIPMQTEIPMKECSTYFSMKDVLHLKDLDRFLNDRKSLLECIAKCKNSRGE